MFSRHGKLFYNMASRSKHLHSLLCKGVPFVWTDAHDAEFCDVKDALISPDTMLYHLDWNSPFELHTDASKHGIGAIDACPVACWCFTTCKSCF